MQLALATGAGPLTHHYNSSSTTAGPSNASTTTRPNKTTARSVPAFLNKLYTMVSDPSTDDLIRWSDDGDSFLVPSADKFGKELLPRFFKHSNFGSFVRQLNMYGFHKVPHLNQGVLKNEGGESTELLEFTNPNFARAQPDLLFFIRRQKAKGESNNPSSSTTSSRHHNNSLSGPSNASTSSSTSTALDLPSLLTDLSAIRKHQTAISADLKDLQQSNQLLWQEALSSREKHRKQEDTINKILRFLAGVFGGQVLDTSGVGNNNNVNGTTSAGVGGVNATSPGSNDSNTDGSVGGGSEMGDSINGESRVGGKGKRKAKQSVVGTGNNIVGFPKGRSRLLLEDVKGRQQERAAALRELDGSEEDLEDEDEDEEIEEIPVLQRDDDDRFTNPQHNSSLPARDPPPTTALTRTNSGFNSLTSPNRFTSIPPPSPSATNAFSNLDFSSFSPETMQQFLNAAGGIGSDPSQFASLFNNSNPSLSNVVGGAGGIGGSSSALSLAPVSSSNSYDFSHGAMIPSTSSSAFNPTTTSNPLDFNQSSTSSTSAPALSPSLISSITANEQMSKSLSDESASLERRTTELEDQISRLLRNLPADTRDQVLANDGQIGTASGLGTAVEEKGGFDWGTATGENGELDLDKLLEQFTNAPTPQANNHSTPGANNSMNEIDPSLSTTMDYSSFFPDPTSATTPESLSNNPLYQSTAGSLPFPSDADPTEPISTTFPYEVTSPQNGQSPSFVASNTATGSPASEVSTSNGDMAAPATKGGNKRTTNGGGRKRKSDVLSPLGEGVASPGREGTRKSSRRKA
ncbi:hypothetical protein JCM3765_005906 [Sporobolomyces pararoseus]